MASTPEQAKVDPTAPSLDLITEEPVDGAESVDGADGERTEALTAGPEESLRGPIRRALEAGVEPQTMNEVIAQEREKLTRQEKIKKQLVDTINRILHDHSDEQSSLGLIVSQMEMEIERAFSGQNVRVLVADKNCSLSYTPEELNSEIETILVKQGYENFCLTFRVNILPNEIVIRPVVKPIRVNQTITEADQGRDSQWRAFKRHKE